METIITLTLQPSDLDHFRRMLREQLAGDHELMRDVLDGREDRVRLPELAARLAFLDRLAAQVGGLY